MKQSAFSTTGLIDGNKLPAPHNGLCGRSKLLLCVALLLSNSVHSAEANAGATDMPCAQIDPGYVLDDSVHGSFGTAQLVSACIDVLRAVKDGRRRLRIFADGKHVLSNDDVAMGTGDGGVEGDPYQPLDVGHGSLIVQNMGGGGPLRWSETWRLTTRNGQWIIAGWDEGAWDFHRAAEGGGEFHRSVNALTGDVRDSYAPPTDDPAPTKQAFHKICKLPPEWRSPSISKVAAIRDRSWHCDATLAKPLRSAE